MVVKMNWSKWNLLIYSFYFCPRTMGKEGLTHTWGCSYIRKKKIAKAIALNIEAVLHKIQTMKRQKRKTKKNMFSSKVILNSLPGFTVNNNVDWLLFECKMKDVGGELYQDIFDLTFGWVWFLVQRANRKLHCVMCKGEHVSLFFFLDMYFFVCRK